MVRIRKFVSDHKAWTSGMVFLAALLLLEQHVLLEGLKRHPSSNLPVWTAVFSGRITSEILIVGSSRAKTHYDCGVLQKRTGMSCFNAGLDGSRIGVQLAQLRVFLKRNRRPRLVVIDIDRNTARGVRPPFKLKEVFDPVQYLPFLHEPEVFRAFCELKPDDCWKHRWIPMYSAAVYGQVFIKRSLSGLFFESQGLQNTVPGIPLNFKTWTDSYERGYHLPEKPFEDLLDPEGTALLVEMIRELRGRGIPVIVVHSPEFKVLQQRLLNYRGLLNDLRRQAEDAGAVFWDFTRISINDNPRCFKDSRHLNTPGALLFSELLARRLEGFLRKTAAPAVPKI